MYEILFLVDNSELVEGVKSTWGLSILVKSPSEKLLFDVGPSFSLLTANASKLGEDLSDVNTVVISHMHSDHAGALKAFIDFNPAVRIFLPASPLSPHYFHANLTYVKGWLALSEGIHVTGPFPSFPEQALAILSRRGPFILVGCSHPGLTSILKKVVEETGVSGILGVAGGFHVSVSKELLIAAEYLKTLSPSIVVPSHCTSQGAIDYLKSELGECVVKGGVGLRLTI